MTEDSFRHDEQQPDDEELFPSLIFSADELDMPKSEPEIELDADHSAPDDLQVAEVAHNKEPNDPQENEEGEENEDEGSTGETLALIGVSLLGIAVVVFLAWLYLPVVRNFLSGTPSPTAMVAEIASTATPRPTFTASPQPTITPQPTATATPYPESAYGIEAIALEPPLPGLEGTVFVLNDDYATAEPPLNSPRWSPSSVIAEQLGTLINEKYYATFGMGSITWQMDKPLQPGSYEIYVMDTLYSSSGPLNFSVKEGSRELPPISGAGKSINFLSNRFEPRQVFDKWRSLGIYVLDSSGLLSVSTAWLERDENNIVAVDRVLVVPISEGNSSILARLPADRERFILDDSAARFEGVQFMVPVTDRLAWDSSFETIINPSNDIKVTWEYPDPLPIGTYEIAIWVPEAKGDAVVNYHLFINDVEELRSDNQPLTFAQGNYPGGQWVSLGVWVTPRIYEKPVSIKLVMEIPANTVGEAAVDAIALLHSPAPASPTP